MKKSISLLVVAALFTACSSTDHVKKNYGSIKKFTRVAPSESIDLDKIKNDLKTNSVFLAGEMHGIKENYILRMNLLKYLHENSGVNYYIAEMGYSSGYFINKYLETGREKYLYLVSNSIVGSYDHSEDDLNFWKSLYAYNQSLPKDNRIEVIGLDIEHQFWLSILQVNDILEDLNLGEELEDDLGRLQYYSDVLCVDLNDSSNIMKNVKRLDIRGVLKVIEVIREDYSKEPYKYTKLMDKETLEAFDMVISNISNTERIYSNKSNSDYFNKEREKAIYENFLRAYDSHPDGRFFGQWGSFHVMQQRSGDEKRFAEYLNSENSPVKDEVLSIKYVYDNRNYKKRNKAILEAFKDYSNSKFTIYDLQTFQNAAKACPSNEFGIEDVTEFFQYGIFVKEPRKVDPLRM